MALMTSTERAEHLEVMHLSEKCTHFAVSSNNGILLAHHAPLPNSASVLLLLTLVEPVKCTSSLGELHISQQDKKTDTLNDSSFKIQARVWNGWVMLMAKVTSNPYFFHILLSIYVTVLRGTKTCYLELVFHSWHLCKWFLSKATLSTGMKYLLNEEDLIRENVFNTTKGRVTTARCPICNL